MVEVREVPAQAAKTSRINVLSFDFQRQEKCQANHRFVSADSFETFVPSTTLIKDKESSYTQLVCAELRKGERSPAVWRCVLVPVAVDAAEDAGQDHVALLVLGGAARGVAPRRHGAHERHPVGAQLLRRALQTSGVGVTEPERRATCCSNVQAQLSFHKLFVAQDLLIHQRWS